MSTQKFDQDPMKVTILKLVRPMCPNTLCKSKKVIIRQVGDLKIYCCNVCGISGETFIDA